MKNHFENIVAKLASAVLTAISIVFYISVVQTVFNKSFAVLKPKKYGYTFLLSLLFAISGFKASSQQLGIYQFNTALAATCPNNINTVAAQPANAVFTKFTNTNGTCVASTTAYLNGSWNQSASIDLTEYNTFTITPNAGYALTLNTLVLTHSISRGSATWALRSSLDNYAANITLTNNTVTATAQTVTVTLPATFTNVGAVTFRLYLIGAQNATANWSNDNVTLNGAVNALPVNPGNPTSNSPQCIGSNITLTRTGTPPAGQTWYWQTTPTGTAVTSSAATYNVTANGTYYIRARNNTTLLWSAGAGSVVVNFTPNVGIPTFTMGATYTRCKGAGSVADAATATNSTAITYKLDANSISAGNSINASSGTVTFVAGWSGSSTITATAAGCGTAAAATNTIITTPSVGPVTFAAGSAAVRCQGAGTVTYTATAANSTGITYSLDATSIANGNSISSNGVVTYAATWTGITTITATAEGCTPTTATYTVTTTPTVGTPVFTTGSASSRCMAAGVIRYTATAGSATAITYSLDAASIAGGNSINVNTGDVTYASNWIGTTVITASAAGCNGPQTSTHTVTTAGPVTDPVFAAVPNTRCQAAGTVTYTATANYSTGVTYSLDAVSLAAGNTINTSGTVTYTAGWSGSSIITASAAGCFGPKTTSYTVTVTPTVGTPVFSASAVSNRCQGTEVLNYSATATSATGITYSMDSISLAGGNTINATTGDVSFAGIWSGTTIIKASAAGCNGPVTSTFTVKVTATVGTPVFSAGTTSTRCQGAATVMYNATATGNTGIIYSLDSASLAAGNTINSANGLVTYGSTWSGTSTVTSTATGCNGPSAATHVVTITATVGTPVFVVGSTSTRCQGAGTIAYTASATNSTAITYSLDAASKTGGNTIVTSTGVVTFSAGWTGNSTITATAMGCNGPSVATHTVTITPSVGKPVFTTGSTSERCFGSATINYSASSTTATGIIYSLDALSIDGNNTIDANTGDVTYSASWVGTTLITAAAQGCNGPATSTHTVIVSGPVTSPVFVLGDSSIRCQGANSVTYNAAANSATSITYSLDSSSIAAGNSINASTGKVNYAIDWAGTSIIKATAAGCLGPQSSTHVVSITPTVGTPVFAMGASSVRCQGLDSVTYTTTATTTTGITYVLDAASTAAGNAINPTTGMVNYSAGWSGTSTITASAAGCNGPVTAIHTVTVTGTVGKPVFAGGATSDRCVGTESIIYTATASAATGIVYSLDSANIFAGNSIDTATGNVSFDAKWVGTSIITATAFGCNGPSTSVHTVTTHLPVTAPVFSNGLIAIRCQGAENVLYTAAADNATAIRYTLDSSSISGGNSIDLTTGILSFAGGWSGSSIVTVSAAGCYGPLTATYTVTTIPTVGVPVFSSGATSARCRANETINYSASAATTTSISYVLDATSSAAGNIIDSLTGDVNFIDSWIGTSVITATAQGCNGPISSTHTVTTNDNVTIPIFALDTASVRCQGAGNVSYTSSASYTSGIAYYIDSLSTNAGNTINSSNGVVTYSGAWSGTTVITAVAPGCQGPQTATHIVTIIPSVGTPVFTIGSTSVRCQGEGSVTYDAAATTTTGITYTLNTASISGGNTIDTSTGKVNYVAGWSGTTVITASAAGCNGPATAKHTVTVTPTVGIPVFVIGATSTRCEGAAKVTYNVTATDNTGIVYRLDSASIMGGNLIDSVTGVVTYTSSWTGTANITAIASGCNGPSSAVHTVTTTPTVGIPVFSAGTTSIRCQGGGSVSYSASATNSTGITYTLDFASRSAGNSINTATGMVFYLPSWSGTSIITASATGCNGPASSTHTITITPTVGKPVFTLSTTSSRCYGAGVVNYSASATTSTSITYSIDAASLSGGNFMDSSSGDLTYDPTWIGTTIITATATGCNGPSSSTHTVTVNGAVTAPVFSLGSTSVRCQGSGTVSYKATAANTTGITYSLDVASKAGGNTINASTGVVTYAAGWSGSSTITASAAGCNGPQTSVHKVTLTPTVGVPVFDMGISSSRCQGSEVVTYDASSTNSTGINYTLNGPSKTAGNTIDAATGTVTYVAGYSGTTIITATATGCNGPKTATHTVTVMPSIGKPVFAKGATSTRCQGVGSLTYSATATNATGIVYSLDDASLAAGNTINPASGLVSFDLDWSGTTVITATASGCNGPSVAIHTVTVTPTVGTPSFALGTTYVRCQGAATIRFSATATNTTGITYKLDNTTYNFGTNNYNPNTGDVLFDPAWTGTSTVTATAAGCNGPTTTVITITTIPTVGTPVFAMGVASNRCQGSNVVRYAATATNSTTITYALDATSTSVGNSINPATADVTYVAGWVGTSSITATASGCNGPKTATHTVTNNPSVTTPVFAIGATSARCQGAATVTYTATANNTSGITYTLDAASTAAGNFIKTNGQLTYTAGWSGTTIITATAAGCNGPASVIHTVTVNPPVTTPVFTNGPTSTRCQGAGTIDYTATASHTTGITYTLDAASKAGGNTINAVTGDVTYVASWSGTSTITASAAGCYGPLTSTLTITTTPTVGTPVFATGSTSTRCQGTTPATYTATATNNTGITYSLDAAAVAAGNTINAATGVVAYVANWTGTTIVTATATGCNGPKSASHTVTITPSVTKPVFTIGGTSTRCQSAGTGIYTATANNTTGYTYSLDAASLAAGNTIAPSTGIVTYVPTWSATSTITVSAAGCNGPQTSQHVVTITPDGTPNFITGLTSTRCQEAGSVIYTASTANNSGVTYSLDSISILAGNTINSTTGVVTYAANWYGKSQLTATATGCNGLKTSVHTVTTTPNGTADFASGTVSSRLQGAGTVKYTATSNNGSAVTYSLDAVSLSAGNSINASTGVVTYTASWNGKTIITASSTGCSGVVTSTHTVRINSTIVTKQLYLSDPLQSLDRIDPVSTNDLTTANTAAFGNGGTVSTISIDNTASNSTTNGTTLSINNFVTGTGVNRIMLVGVALDADVTSITYSGQNLTKVSFVGSVPRTEIWQLTNPPSGTGSILITASASVSIKASVTTFTGVDQSAPYRTPVTGSGNSIPSVTVTSASNELVYDIVAVSNGPTITASTGQNEQSNIRDKIVTTGTTQGSSTKLGATSIAMSWATSTNPNPWTEIAISLKPAPTLLTATTFTQSPALCTPLTIKAGNNISVTNYLSIVSGTMPANPNITALLRYGSTNIVKLTNPVYNSAIGILTWTSSLGSDITIPAGQAIALDITSSQTGVSFKINYDSKASPSRIDLPVSTYINITSLDVYNAPYPGGSVIISGVTGSANYIRATVSDPFGSTDITGLDLTITPSGSVVPATSVASNGCTSTYEYVWNTTSTNGSYNILARAKEGFENSVINEKSTNFYFCTTCPPVAFNDSATGAGGTPLLLDVLANDYDPNNNLNKGSLAITTQPQNGSALLSGGKIVYLPNGNFAGKDTLTYQICDFTSPAPLCSIGQIYVDIDPTIIDPCADASKSHVYYVPYPEEDARTALLASQNVGLAITNIRTIISLKMPYPNMTIVWDQWEDGYEANILSPQQSSTLVWGDGNPYNGIAPGYPNDIIPAGGSIVLDNTIPSNPRVAANFFYDGKDKVYSSGQITMTQVSGEPLNIGLQAMKTNVSSTTDFGKSFTIPTGENFNSRDFRYTALFIRASTNNTIVNIDKDNNGTFETTATLNEGQSLLVNGGVLNGATITGSAPIGVDLHFGGVDGFSSREVPIFPATWYSNVYYTPVPTTKSPDSAVVMLYNSLSRPIKVNWFSGAPASGAITLPSKTVVRFPLALSATSTYKFVNPTGEAFTAIEIVDSYTPGSTTNVNGPNYDWSFNLISEPRLTTYATIAWAPGSTDGTRNDNPIWVTPATNTMIYVKYNGDVLNGGSISPCGLHYDVSYPLNALNYKRILDNTDKDQSGIAIYTCDNTKIAAVYGEDPSTAAAGNPSWDVGTTIQPFCATKIVLANDDNAFTMTSHAITIDVLANDTGFQSTIDPSSVITAGYLQPKHGTVSVNPDGSLLYTPDAGYIGIDSLEYNVCSTPSPVVCDKAMVIIKIDACPTPNNKNIISGQIFLDKNKDGLNNDGGDGFPLAKLYLYADGNCSGTITPTELKDSVMVDRSGNYQFVTYPEKTVEDDFDGAGGVSSCNSGSDGTSGWLTNWVDAGDPSVGFCVTPAQSYANTDAEIIKDGTFGYALRLKGANVSATRTVNLSGATAGFLSFSYRRAAALAAGENVAVQASANGTTWTTIFTIFGDGKTDASYVPVYNQNILPYVSANTYIRFVTNASMDDADEVFIDNISITYLKYPQCYVTKVDPSAIIPYYHFTTASQNALTASTGGTCLFPFDFGIVKNSMTISGTVFNDVNGLKDGLVNGTAIGTPAGKSLYAYLVDSAGKVAFKTTVSSTGVYSFPQADVFTTYSVMISTVDSGLYTNAPVSAKLPSGWVSVGENYGTVNGAGTGVQPGISTSSVTVTTALANITGVNFGIEQLPVAGSGKSSAIDLGGATVYTVPSNTFTNSSAGSDVAPGTITSIRITIFPQKITTLVINGTLYTSANFPLGGIVIPANASGQPTQPVLIDPIDGFVKVSIPFYTIDNAGKESATTGTAIMQFLLDTDKDGIADINDIDDENDGIPDVVELCGNGATTFSCLPGGIDPSLDSDDDGIVNYKDADYGPLNAAGCLASIDTDGDGIPDYLDADSDNDGVPDVVEAYGVDANGDGIIDNFTDTDGDGLSQNVDANNSGSAGSGQGLGFKDFDGDGRSNTKDLDSDNDGIPDIIEAGGMDANNDGRINTFADTNLNGLDDICELAGALIKTGLDINNDGRPDSYPNRNTDQLGYPNPYDLDSDGDGITDALEAGFPASISISNGTITGVAVNGWANSVQALANLSLLNTDGVGPENYLDIDSDDDGISDNIEGQPTATYKIPTDVDADNDGLADVYETAVGTFGGPGITPNNQDGDGVPDYKDLDTDNDGKPDLNEASNNNALTKTTINAADTDGDGLLDEFDLLNVNTIVPGSKYTNLTNSKMGVSGSLSGPPSSGSNVTLVKTYSSNTDRDWRIVNVLTLGDAIWFDFNSNGLKDPEEVNISGAAINLYADANADNVADGAAIATTISDIKGNYQFANLATGKYIVGVILPAGYTLGATVASGANPNNGIDNDNNGVTFTLGEVRTNNINITANNNTVDIGLKGTGSIGNFVFYDVNGNGIQDAGETGIAGVTVTLSTANGLTLTTSTNSTGNYTFSNLGDGTYTIGFSTPPGYFASDAAQGADRTKDSDPVNGEVSVTLAPAQVLADVDAGYYLPFTIGDAVWYDFNNNGLRDFSEPPILGATIKLYPDANGDNIPDGLAIDSTASSVSGNYQFNNLLSKNYIVSIVLPEGYKMGAIIGSSTNPNNNIDNDNNGVSTNGREVFSNYIRLSGSNNSIDIGLQGTSVIGDFVFNDLDGNGMQDAGEPGLEGITVTLASQSGASYVVTTNASGAYAFKGLVAGTYTITFATPAGYIPSDDSQGIDKTKDSDPVGGTVTVTLASDEFRSDIDAGYYKPYIIGNTVWLDANKNGFKDAGETGISGVTVNLYADTDGDNLPDNTDIATTTTNANGNYKFTGLLLGNYIVSVVLPPMYEMGAATTTSADPNNNIENDNNGVKLKGNEIFTNSFTINGNNNSIDFGLQGSASIGDFVWFDANGNGIQDFTESGMKGVSITLTNSSGLNISDTTDASGKYNFSGLMPGTYTLHFTTPSVLGAPKVIPFIPRKSNLGGDVTKDSDPNPATGDVTVVLAAGELNMKIDAGFAEDQDDDNDGIANTLENCGYKPFNDCDGDGIPNYLDSTPGCSTPGGNDLYGNPYKPITWSDANSDGINDFFDFDHDGIINELDLDSDNDGIPDIKESQDKRAVDANNDGMADGVDNDDDGVLSSADQNDNSYGDEALVTTDVDKDGKSNFMDLDSDGDGIVDAIEAIYPTSVSVSNGLVTGAATNGWANSVKTLGSFTPKNTDGRGSADYLDIDSDDDGISDNVEGQSTGSYVVADDADTDGDGVADVYDLSVNAFGSNGITPYDHDYDGKPDYIDTDTDNDGALDINEASMAFGINQGNINTTDTDGDGMVDQFDITNINSLAAGSRFKNVTNSQMGPGGGFDGPTPSGSSVQLVQSVAGRDRDWRSVSILPLKIVSFTGTLVNNIAQLVWKVQNEQDVDFYVVERSKDATSFEGLKQVKGLNNPASVYTETDDLTSYTYDVVYYRIKQVDKNGEVFYSKVVAFKNGGKASVKIKAYPNPVYQSLVLDIVCLAKENTSATIFDAAGKAVLQKSFNLEKGENAIRFSDVRALAKGQYIIVVIIQGSPYTVRVIKE